MAVTIRLTRRGRRKMPFYRVVAADRRMPRDGRFLEILGTYDPLTETGGVRLDRERVDAWVAKGATVSPAVRDLLKRTPADA